MNTHQDIARELVARPIFEAISWHQYQSSMSAAAIINTPERNPRPVEAVRSSVQVPTMVFSENPITNQAAPVPVSSTEVERARQAVDEARRG